MQKANVAAWLLVIAIVLLALARLVNLAMSDAPQVQARPLDGDGRAATHGPLPWEWTATPYPPGPPPPWIATSTPEPTSTLPSFLKTATIEAHIDTIQAVETGGPIITLGPSPTPTTVPICERGDVVCTGPVLELQ